MPFDVVQLEIVDFFVGGPEFAHIDGYSAILYFLAGAQRFLAVEVRVNFSPEYHVAL